MIGLSVVGAVVPMLRGNVEAPRGAALMETPEPTRKQAIRLQAVILAALRKRDGQSAVGEGAPARWKSKEAAN